MNRSIEKLNKPVFITSSLFILALIIYTVIDPKTAGSNFSYLQNAIVTNGSWFYVLTVTIILAFAVYMSISNISSIKLGPDHAVPDYSFYTWLSMLFATGMGIGLMFFGVAEPVMHYLSPPIADKNTLEAAQEAMKITFSVGDYTLGLFMPLLP